MITFIESGNRIATENFETGEIYTITYTIGNYRTMCCIGIGTDFVMFQGTSPNALFCLTMGTSETVSTIELGGGGSGTMNYNELENKPQINGIVLIGNKTASDLNLVSQNELDNYVTDTELSTELADYATNASVVSALASKQDTLTTAQLTAVNSGITSILVNQITTNKNNILKAEQLTINTGVVNLSKFSTGDTSATKWITGSGNTDVSCDIKAGNYVLIANFDYDSGGNNIAQMLVKNTDNTDATLPGFATSSNTIVNFTLAKDIKSFGVYVNQLGVTVTNFAIIPKTVYDIGYTSYIPYTPTNYELYQMILALQ